WMAMEWIRHGKPSVLGIVTGMVAGLGTITPASGFVGPGGALVIGLPAAVVCYLATQAIKQKFKIDDTLDVFPVHGVGGILGTLFAGIFASDALGVFSGQGYNEGMTMGSQLQVQAIGVVATLVYTAVVTWVLLKVLGLLMGLRVDGEQETVGLDLSLHDERGYDIRPPRAGAKPRSRPGLCISGAPPRANRIDDSQGAVDDNPYRCPSRGAPVILAPPSRPSPPTHPVRRNPREPSPSRQGLPAARLPFLLQVPAVHD